MYGDPFIDTLSCINILAPLISRTDWSQFNPFQRPTPSMGNKTIGKEVLE